MKKEEKLNNRKLRIFINSKGLGHAVQYTVNSNEIEDKEISKYWKYAKKYLNLIKNRLNEKLIKENDV
jgi:hypothetical protein